MTGGQHDGLNAVRRFSGPGCRGYRGGPAFPFGGGSLRVQCIELYQLATAVAIWRGPQGGQRMATS